MHTLWPLQSSEFFYIINYTWRRAWYNYDTWSRIQPDNWNKTHINNQLDIKNRSATSPRKQNRGGRQTSNSKCRIYTNKAAILRTYWIPIHFAATHKFTSNWNTYICSSRWRWPTGYYMNMNNYILRFMSDYWDLVLQILSHCIKKNSSVPHRSLAFTFVLLFFS